MGFVSKIAYRYAQALREAAHDLGQSDAIRKDHQQVKALLEEIPQLRDFLKSPIITVKEKREVLEKVFQTRVSPLFFRFLQLILSKRREYLLEEILQAMERLEERAQHKERVVIQLAVDLSESEKIQIVKALEQVTGKKLIPTFEIRPELLGGFVALFEDQRIDASILTQLRRLRQTLVKGVNGELHTNE